MSDACSSKDYSLQGSSVHGIPQARILEPFPSPGDLLTQGSNPGLLHYRQILYCLSHQESRLSKTWTLSVLQISFQLFPFSNALLQANWTPSSPECLQLPTPEPGVHKSDSTDPPMKADLQTWNKLFLSQETQHNVTRLHFTGQLEKLYPFFKMMEAWVRDPTGK